MNEITVNRTDRRTDTPKENPFLDRRSNYSVSSPKTPRMQKRHKEMETELLETPEIKESNSLEITVTAEDADIKKPLERLPELFQIRKNLELHINYINNNFRHNAEVGSGEYYAFNIKMNRRLYADWMDNTPIPDDKWSEVLGQTVMNFAGELVMDYEWMSHYSQGGRSGGWLVIHPDAPYVELAEEFLNESFSEDDELDVNNIYQEDIDELIQRGKVVLAGTKLVSDNLSEISEKVRVGKNAISEQLVSKDFWRAQGIDIPVEPSPETRKWEERWQRRSSLRKKAEFEGKKINIYYKDHIEMNGRGITRVTVDDEEIGVDEFFQGLVEDVGAEYPDFYDNEVSLYINASGTYDIDFDAQPEVNLDKYNDFIRYNYDIFFFCEDNENREVTDDLENRDSAMRIKERREHDKYETQEEKDKKQRDKDNWNNRWQRRSSLKKKARVYYFHGDQEEDGKMVSYKVEADDVNIAEDIARLVAREHGMGLAGGMNYDTEPSDAVIYESTHVTPEQIGTEQTEQETVRQESIRTQYHHQGENPVAVYDESEATDSQIEFVKEAILDKDYIYDSNEEIMEVAEKHKGDDAGFWNEIKAIGKEDELNELIQNSVYENTDYLSWYAEDWIEAFNGAMAGVSTGDTWVVRGEDVGWQRQSGEVVVEAEDSQGLIEKIFPRTQEYTARVWNHTNEETGIKGLFITVGHHDGRDKYYVMPKEPKGESAEKIRKWEERWMRRGSIKSELVVFAAEDTPEVPINPEPTGRAIDRLRPIPNLWYENKDGEKLHLDLSQMNGMPNEDIRELYPYQVSRFPVLRDSICTDEGEVMSGETTINCITPIVIYLVTQLDWSLTDAITVAATTCERCMNILLEETTGEPYEGRDKAGTHCELCAVIDPKYDDYYKANDDTSELCVPEGNGDTMTKESSAQNDITWKALRLAFKLTSKADDRYPEFQSNSFVIFTQDAKFRMDQLDAMGEIKKNMVGKVKKVNDESLSIEIGKQTYEVPLIDAFKVMQPFTAQIVVEPDKEQDMPQGEPDNELMPGGVAEEVPEEQPEEGSQVRPGISMERDELKPVPIRTPQKPAEKALSVETVLKNVLKRIGRTSTYKEEVLLNGTKINLSIGGQEYGATIKSRVQGGYQVVLDDGRKVIIEDEMITDVGNKPVTKLPDSPAPASGEKENIPVESEVWVVLDRMQSIPNMSRGVVVNKGSGIYNVLLHNGETVEVSEQDIKLESLPDPKKKMPFTPYRYSKRGLFPAQSVESVQSRSLVYVATRGYYTLGRVTGKGADTLKIDLIDGTSKDYGINEVYLTEMSPEMRSQMMQKYTDWTTEAVVVSSDGLIKMAYEGELVRTIDCSSCGQWEEMQVDDARHNSQTFEWQENVDDDALYKCECGQVVRSKFSSDLEEGSEETRKWEERWQRRGAVNKKAEYENMTVQTTDIPEELKKQIKTVQDGIDKDMLYTGEDEDGWVEGGLQKLFHTTILYGVDPKDKDAISQRINELIAGEKLMASTADVEYFDHEDKGYTAAVLRLESEGLNKLHDALKKEFDNKDSYPEYKTHVTIAYLKLNTRLDGIEFAPTEWEIDGIEITNKDGSMTKVAQENDDEMYEEDIRSACIDCQEEMEIETDIQLCQECMKNYDVERLWEMHDNDEIDALSFNESAQIREQFRKSNDEIGESKKTQKWEERWHKRSEYSEGCECGGVATSSHYEDTGELVLKCSTCGQEFESMEDRWLDDESLKEENKKKENIKIWEERWHKKSNKGVVDMEKKASINPDDVGYSYNYDGYMMQYKGQNIGGAGRRDDGYTKVRKNKKDFEYYRQMAEITKRDILDGKIPPHMQEAVNRIDQESTGQQIEGSVVLGSVEISDQMLDKDGLWVSPELWRPEISYRVEQIEMSLGQIERGVNVTAQIRSFIDDLDEILEKIPNDQLTSAQDYISEQMSERSPEVQAMVKAYFNKTADNIDAPITELNKIIKKKDKETMCMQNPEEKGRIREPSNPQTVQQDVNIDARNSTPLAGTTVRKKVTSKITPPKSEFFALEADIKSGFKQIIDEIEMSDNPYVVSEIGRKLYKQQKQRDNEIVREGNVSRILP